MGGKGGDNYKSEGMFTEDTIKMVTIKRHKNDKKTT